MKKVAVVLAGCGVYDGAEIHESVLTLLALDRRNADVTIFAPDSNQHHVIDHTKGSEANETRNVLVESARIARGEITDLAEANAADFDAIIFPGGFGAAKNLCNFAVKGPDCDVNPHVETFIKDGLNANKVMGFICIAPALLAKVSGKMNLQLEVTIGTDPGTAEAVEAMGARHVNCSVTDIVVDAGNKIVTTPAYMLGQRISEVAEGIDKLVAKVLELA